MRASTSIGRQGEKEAARHCERQGMRILARNVRLAAGEIDLIAEDRGVIVFIEVKTRSRPGSEAWEAVDWHKRKRIAKAATAWLALHERQNSPCRFDVIVLALRAGGIEVLAHLRDAWRLE